MSSATSTYRRASSNSMQSRIRGPSSETSRCRRPPGPRVHHMRTLPRPACEQVCPAGNELLDQSPRAINRSRSKSGGSLPAKGAISSRFARQRCSNASGCTASATLRRTRPLHETRPALGRSHGRGRAPTGHRDYQRREAAVLGHAPHDDHVLPGVPGRSGSDTVATPM